MCNEIQCNGKRPEPLSYAKPLSESAQRASLRRAGTPVADAWELASDVWGWAATLKQEQDKIEALTRALREDNPGAQGGELIDIVCATYERAEKAEATVAERDKRIAALRERLMVLDASWHNRRHNQMRERCEDEQCQLNSIVLWGRPGPTFSEHGEQRAAVDRFAQNLHTVEAALRGEEEADGHEEGG